MCILIICIKHIIFLKLVHKTEQFELKKPVSHMLFNTTNSNPNIQLR